MKRVGRSLRRSIGVAGAVTTMLALLAGTAVAQTPIGEPNNDVATAFGPLAADTVYAGDFASTADPDWLVFYTTNALPVQVLVAKVGAGCSPYLLAYVVADTGAVMKVAGFTFSDTTTDLTFLPPGAGRYYVSLANDCAGDPYTVRVGPASGVTISSPLIGFAPTPHPVATVEPNDTAATAQRLAGGNGYGGAVDASYDVDFFVFRLAAGRNVEVSITKVGDGCGSRIETSVRKAATPDSAIAEHHVTRNATVYHRFTSDGLADHLVRISGTCAADPYQLRIDPANAVVAPDSDADGRSDNEDRCPTVAAGSADGCPAKVKPRGIRLVLLPRRDARAPFRFRASGSIGLPAALPAAAACRGKVAIRFRARGRSIAFATTPLRPDCKYGRTFTFSSRRAFAGARQLEVSATFRGNTLLRSATHVTVARVR